MSTSNGEATLRCPFCLTLTQVDISRASERPKCESCEKPILLDRPVRVTEEDFDTTVLGSPVPTLVDFYADWCGPCKAMAPLLDEIAARHSGKILVGKVDTDRAPDLARRFEIKGIPTLIVFAGGEESGRSVGFDRVKIERLVQGLVS